MSGRLNISEFSAIALRSVSRPTISTTNPCRQGISSPPTTPKPHASATTRAGVAVRVATSTVSTVESTRDATCTQKRSRRLFTRSASAPPGNENNAMPSRLAADEHASHRRSDVRSLTSHACAAWRPHVPTLDTAIPTKKRR
jgi:hypothetical protein